MPLHLCPRLKPWKRPWRFSLSHTLLPVPQDIFLVLPSEYDTISPMQQAHSSSPASSLCLPSVYSQHSRVISLQGKSDHTSGVVQTLQGSRLMQNESQTPYNGLRGLLWSPLLSPPCPHQRLLYCLLPTYSAPLTSLPVLEHTGLSILKVFLTPLEWLPPDIHMADLLGVFSQMSSSQWDLLQPPCLKLQSTFPA